MYHTIKNFKERYNLKYPYIFNPFSKRFQNKKKYLKNRFSLYFYPSIDKNGFNMVIPKENNPKQTF